MIIFIEERGVGVSLKIQLSTVGVTVQKKSAFSKFKDLFSLRYDEIHSVTVESGFFSSKLIINNMFEPEIKFNLDKHPKLLKDLIDLGCVNLDELLDIIGDDSITYRLRDIPDYIEKYNMVEDEYKIKFDNYIEPDSVIEHIKNLKESGAYDAPSMESCCAPEPGMNYSQVPNIYAGGSSFMVSVNGQEAGPYTILELQQFVATGEFTPQVYVWREGMPQWELAGNVPELANLF